MATTTRTELQILATTVEGLMDAAASLREDTPTREWLQEIVQRQKFRPAENEVIGFWFARFLTIRNGLWPAIDSVIEALDGKTLPSKEPSDEEMRLFVVGYAAVCLLVGIDRLMLFGVASHSVIQRKLNEEFLELRIPRKQYTYVFEAFVNEKHALALLNAMKFAKKHRKRMLSLSSDPDLAVIVEALPELKKALDPSIKEYFRGAWKYVSHKWRRLGVVSANNVLSSVTESVGRTASEFYQTTNKQVTQDIRDLIIEFLRPGDVIITRHAVALTNLFMPGFWPHAALYIGTPSQRDAYGIEVAEGKLPLWKDDICTLEALKDGVRMRTLDSTLGVDYFAVLRPQVSNDIIAKAIERAIVHEGKGYNFDFDFFSSDRLVCTEVIYRAYDGIGGIEFRLSERAGRKTLSAEELLDFSLDSDSFEPVALFGVAGCEKEIAFGKSVVPLLSASYRKVAT
ncbi:MAG: YiiX/YebB-like N1pC/P60 family cysteine hydrolase [Pseudomonadota bacterium]